MEILRVLEEKIVALLSVVQDLKSKNQLLKLENERINTEYQALENEHIKLLDENAQFTLKLQMMENSVLKGNERVEETKVAVDDLIRSIDALVASEHQQQ